MAGAASRNQRTPDPPGDAQHERTGQIGAVYVQRRRPRLFGRMLQLRQLSQGPQRHAILLCHTGSSLAHQHSTGFRRCQDGQANDVWCL